jgi:hypothetical protein
LATASAPPTSTSPRATLAPSAAKHKAVARPMPKAPPIIAAGHCTGEPTFTALKKAFADRYLYGGLGTTCALGATPRPIAGASQPTRMDEDDLKGYRALLAKSCDHTVIAHHHRSPRPGP